MSKQSSPQKDNNQPFPLLGENAAEDSQFHWTPKLS